MKKWIIENLYKRAKNGKLELFGYDGLEHAFISFLIILEVFLITLWSNTLTALIAVSITFIILRIVWFYIEYKQEKAMIKADPKRINHGMKFWKYSKSRKVDMYYSIPVDSIILVIAIYRYFN